MSKRRRKLGQSLEIKDWMRFRPYKEFTAYDGYYLRLAKGIFDYLNHPRRVFRDLFQRADLQEVAILLTCHFEDFVSEIGLWQAFRQKNLALYGYVLPFYELDDYDPEYLNPEDFAYLLWHHLGSLGQKTMHPYGGPLQEAANYCYEFFEPRIDEAPATDFYDDWLTIEAEIPFFKLKERLIWMINENYILGPAFIRDFKEQVEEFFEGSSKNILQLDPNVLIYGMREDYLFRNRSSWCGHSAVEWLADVVHSTDEIKSAIRNMSRRVRGLFVYVGQDDQHYHFEFLSSGRLFKVDQASVTLNPDKLESDHILAYFGIVPWQDNWWLSGSYMEWPYQDKNLDQLRLDPQYNSFYGLKEEHQDRMRKMTKEMEETFLSYFGQRLVFFENDKAMSKAIQSHHDWWNEQRAIEVDPSKTNTRFEDLLKEKSNTFDQLDLGKGKMAAFFLPNQGVYMSGTIPVVIKWLQEKELSAKDAHELFYAFFSEFDPPLTKYIVEQYPMDNLQFPLSIDQPDFMTRHFDFFHRYYNPDAFGEQLPNTFMIPEE